MQTDLQQCSELEATILALGFRAVTVELHKQV